MESVINEAGDLIFESREIKLRKKFKAFPFVLIMVS